MVRKVRLVYMPSPLLISPSLKMRERACEILPSLDEMSCAGFVNPVGHVVVLICSLFFSHSPPIVLPSVAVREVGKNYFLSSFP